MATLRSRTKLTVVGLLVMAAGGAPASSQTYEASVPAPGLQVSVTVSPPAARAGAPVTVRVQVKDKDQSQNSLRVDFGDTTGSESAFTGECDESRTGTALDAEYVFEHRYRAPGEYAVTASVFTGTCDDVGDPPIGPGSESRAAVARVTVLRASVPSNGGSPPRNSMVSSFRARVGTAVKMQFEGADDDGFIRRIEVVDHANRRRVFVREDACIDPLLTWPRDAWQTPPFEETFDQPGSYAYKVRTVSSGCDGKSVQESNTVHRTVVTR